MTSQTSQELLEEVLRQADSHQDAIFLHLIEKEEERLRDVPEHMSHEEWVRHTLGMYTHAKLQAHRIRRLIHSGCGSSVGAHPRHCEVMFYSDWERKLHEAEDEVEEARALYYRAVGRPQKPFQRTLTR